MPQQYHLFSGSDVTILIMDVMHIFKVLAPNVHEATLDTDIQ
jgi:hypothetical protein